MACTSGCTSTCGGNCGSGCGESCGSGCTGYCGTQCEGGCTGSCQGSGSGSCTNGCEHHCATGCSGGCSTSCVGSCKGNCTGSCKDACNSGCTSEEATGLYANLSLHEFIEQANVQDIMRLSYLDAQRFGKMAASYNTTITRYNNNTLEIFTQIKTNLDNCISRGSLQSDNTGQRYQFHDGSYITDGWLLDNNDSNDPYKYYFFNTQGYMIKNGWVEIGDRSGQTHWYYFDNNGRMARNTTIGNYQVDNYGVRGGDNTYGFPMAIALSNGSGIGENLQITKEKGQRLINSSLGLYKIVHGLS